MEDVVAAAASSVSVPRELLDVELLLAIDSEYDASADLWRLGAARAGGTAANETLAGLAQRVVHDRANRSRLAVRLVSLASRARGDHAALARELRAAWVRLFPRCPSCDEGHLRRLRADGTRFAACARGFERGAVGCGQRVRWAVYLSAKARLVLQAVLSR